jgi:adenosylcobinamide-phosphate synthase
LLSFQSSVHFMFFALLAIGLDLLCGDPPWLWHPVRGIGRLACWIEKAFRRRATTVADRVPLSPERRLKLAGALGLCLVVAISAGCAYALASIPRFGPYLAVYLAYSGLALGQLLRESEAVASLLEKDSIEEARDSLAYLVSRDTGKLDRDGLGRTLAETVSENCNDGFVAPFFYLFCGALLGNGQTAAASAVGLLWGYKAVSTLDSMWGYKTEDWRAFGWAAARADDVLAFLPARLSALAFIAAGALRAGLRQEASAASKVGGWKALLRGVRADAGKTESPNAGWPMAAAAWSLHCRVGGPAVYCGRLKEKPWLGPNVGGSWDGLRLRSCLQLTLWAGCLAAAGLWLAWGALTFLL